MKIVCAHCGQHFTPQFCYSFKRTSLCVECFRTYYCVEPMRPAKT